VIALVIAAAVNGCAVDPVEPVSAEPCGLCHLRLDESDCSPPGPDGWRQCPVQWRECEREPVDGQCLFVDESGAQRAETCAAPSDCPKRAPVRWRLERR
jgi:hypothetical protein